MINSIPSFRSLSRAGSRAVGLGLVLTSGAFAQGANDCGNAQPISGVGSFPTNTQSATTDGPSSCAQLGRDVWFSWTAPTTASYTFSFCGNATYDTALAAYSGTCGSLSLITCNDDSCGLQSEISISAMSGSAYLLQVGGWNGAQGQGTLVVTLGGGGSGGCLNPASGPDVIVGGIPDISNYGAVSGVAGYALGTTSCNVGDAELLWIANNNQHPVIGQNIYRLENGRFEQLGMSYLKHGFTALQQNLCCSCNSSGTGSRLGVGCSDPYSSGLNGSQGGLGPRWQVNAHTGAFAYPFSQQGQTGDRAFKRIQVLNDDVNPSLHPTAQYFGEAQYITPDDAAAGNGLNNVSWVNLNRTGGTSTGGAFNLAIAGATNREEAAIYAWQANIPAVTIAEINVAGEGQFIAGSNVIDNGDGTWRYEYAIFNNTSDFSGQSFTVPVGTGVTVTNVGMSFPLYHSGEPYTNATWASTVNPSSVTWESETFAQTANANALRWGTTYSFWFTANAGPEASVATLGLFKPGNPGPQSVALDAPGDASGGGVIIQNFCATNLNSSGQAGALTVSNVDLVGRTLQLDATGLPPSQFGLFITSLTSGFVPNLAGGNGNLCVVGSIGRGVAGGIQSTGATGQMQGVANLDQMPTSNSIVSVQPGETRFFQAWHRDFVLQPTSNLSNAVSVTFP